MVGIGGTGVVTASKVLAEAAARDGWHVAGLDQTGLSQKAGAVVSHLRAARRGEPLTNTIGDAGCDVMFAFDPLAAADPRHLARLHSERSRVVVAASVTPTVSVITQPEAAMPSADALAQRIARHAVSAIQLDAEGLSQALFGDHLPANILSLGVAVQAGLLPISPAAVEWAISRLGRGAAVSLAAFRWGRAIRHDPSLAESLMRPAGAPSLPTPSPRRSRPLNGCCAARRCPPRSGRPPGGAPRTSSITRTRRWPEAISR